MMPILVIDNYDSFTYNLVQLLGELGAEPVVRRNDELTVADAERLRPRALVISPGPGLPSAAGISVPLIQALAGRVPILGVCLGHQAIGEAFGAQVVRAGRLMHGKTTEIAHDGDGILAGLPVRFPAMRYHSLVIDPGTVPAELRVTAWSGDRPRGAEVMAVQHRSVPVYGVQFHPESVGTNVGKTILRNFLGTAASTPD